MEFSSSGPRGLAHVRVTPTSRLSFTFRLSTLPQSETRRLAKTCIINRVENPSDLCNGKGGKLCLCSGSSIWHRRSFGRVSRFDYFRLSFAGSALSLLLDSRPLTRQREERSSKAKKEKKASILRTIGDISSKEGFLKIRL